MSCDGDEHGESDNPRCPLRSGRGCGEWRSAPPRVSEMGTTRLEISFRVRAEFSHQFHGSDVIIRVPTPSTTSSAKVSVGAGKAKYDGAQKAIVWKVKRWTGGQELSFQAEVTLLSTTKGSDGAATKWSRPPIRFEFQVSMLAVSGLLVRFLKVNEPKLGYQVCFRTGVGYVRPLLVGVGVCVAR